MRYYVIVMSRYSFSKAINLILLYLTRFGNSIFTKLILNIENGCKYDTEKSASDDIDRIYLTYYMIPLL